jgi:hypothetical protein
LSEEKKRTTKKNNAHVRDGGENGSPKENKKAIINTGARGRE